MIVPLGLAINSTLHLFLPRMLPTPSGLLVLWPKLQGCLHHSLDLLQRYFLLWASSSTGSLPYYPVQGRATSIPRCEICCLQNSKGPTRLPSDAAPIFWKRERGMPLIAAPLKKGRWLNLHRIDLCITSASSALTISCLFCPISRMSSMS